jgi:Uma2 family endonuclease
MALVARRPITVEEFQRMGKAGIFGPEERVELIDGVIFQMNAIDPPHASTVGRWTRALVRAIGDDGFVWVQNPVVTDALSEPQPDIAVLRPDAEDYFDGLPRPESVYGKSLN